MLPRLYCHSYFLFKENTGVISPVVFFFPILLYYFCLFGVTVTTKKGNIHLQLRREEGTLFQYFSVTLKI